MNWRRLKLGGPSQVVLLTPDRFPIASLFFLRQKASPAEYISTDMDTRVALALV